VPYGDLQTKLQTYVASGDPPDILMGKGDFVPSYVFNEIALDLTPYLSTAFLNDIMPAVRNAQSVGGKLYAWPWEQGNTMFYFNKDLFQKANVQTPPETTDLSQGWTWQQLSDAWKQLNAALNKPGAEPSIYALAASEYGPGGPGSSYFYESIYIRSLGDPS